VFERFAEGTSNPWGVDFDEHGQAFCTACVIPHLFHIIQGARYERQAGAHFNPYTYDETSRRSPTTATTSATIRTPATATPTPPAAATPTPAR
jgi:hypothetical protein